MTVAHPGAAARRRAPAVLTAALLALAAILSAPVLDPDTATAEASAGRPLAVIVVGPVAGMTAYYKRDARRIAERLRAYGARVRQVYSPYATWSRVKEASRGAHLFVYLGHGNGYPSPYGRFNPDRMNGLGLNRRAGQGNSNTRYYGESYVRRSLRLAPGAVVVLNHVCYAAGSSEPGHRYPTRRTATRRADNFAAGFLDAGASVVFAGDRSISTIVRDLFRSGRTMQSVFWNSPWTSRRYDSRFRSGRTPGAVGILAPYSPGRYFQSVVGRLTWTAMEWRATWAPPPATPAPEPVPDPAAAPSDDPAVPGTDPTVPDPSAEPTPGPSATPPLEPSPAPTPAPDPPLEPPAEPSPAPTPAPDPSPAPAEPTLAP